MTKRGTTLAKISAPRVAGVVAGAGRGGEDVGDGWEQVVADYARDCETPGSPPALLEATIQPDGAITARRIAVPTALVEVIERRALRRAHRSAVAALDHAFAFGEASARPTPRRVAPPPLPAVSEEARADARRELRRVGHRVRPEGGGRG